MPWNEIRCLQNYLTARTACYNNRQYNSVCTCSYVYVLNMKSSYKVDTECYII